MADDATIAPTSAPPAAAPTEVVVDTQQVSSPTPIGSQAPAAEPKPTEHRSPSRREAIQAAFDRAASPQRPPAKTAPRATPGPAEAKPGHNKPPAEDPEPPLDLKKRPADQPRGERGRFAPREPSPVNVTENVTNPPSNVAAPTAGAPAKPAHPPLPNNAPYRQPLSRMSEAAKADWAGTPESVRGDLHRMHQEFKKASDFFKQDHATMNSIRQFHELATSQGTTLQAALGNYVGIEQKLRRDPIGGLDTIVNNLNLKTQDGQKIGLRDIAWHILNQTPEQLQMTQHGNAQAAASQQIGALYQEVVGLKNTLHQMHNQQRLNHLRVGVDNYAVDKPRFDELGDLIEQEVKLGFDLDTAYRRAELLRPATQAAQTRTTPAQTRIPDRSISGAPDASGSHANGFERKPVKPVSRREALANAMSRVNGRL